MKRSLVKMTDEFVAATAKRYSMLLIEKTHRDLVEYAYSHGLSDGINWQKGDD